MSSRAVQIADGIVTLIGAQNWATWEAKRVWPTQSTLESLDKLGRIHVIPPSRSWGPRRSRAPLGFERNIDIAIGIHKRHHGKPGEPDKALIDSIEQFADDLGELLMNHDNPIDGTGFRAWCQEIDNPTIVAYENLVELRVVTSVLTAKYRIA